MMSRTDLVKNFSFREIHKTGGDYRRRIVDVDPKTMELLDVGDTVLQETRRRVPVAGNQVLDFYGHGVVGDTLIKEAREVMEARASEAFASNPSDRESVVRKLLHESAEATTRDGCGNCGEYSLVAYHLAHEALHDKKINVPIVNVISEHNTVGAHDMVLLGDPRERSSKNIVVIDPWPVAATVFTRSEAAHARARLTTRISVHASMPPSRLSPGNEETRIFSKPPLSLAELDELADALFEKGHFHDTRSLARDVSTVYRNSASGETASYASIPSSRAQILRKALDIWS